MTNSSIHARIYTPKNRTGPFPVIVYYHGGGWVVAGPLQSEGMFLRDKLTKAGVKVSHQAYEGTTHEFFGTAAIVPEANQAQDKAAEDFKNAFK